MDVVRSDIESSVLDYGFTNDCIVTFKEVSRLIHNSPAVRVCDLVERGAQNIMFSKSVFHADSESAEC